MTVDAWLDSRASMQRQENIERCLRTVRAGYGKVTPNMLAKRYAWTPRSVQRYLNELREVGYAEPVARQVGKESAWRATDAGKAYLLDVTAGYIGTSLDLHPAPQERDQQCQPTSK